VFLLVAALALFALSGITLVAWGCSGGLNPLLPLFSSAAVVTGLILLGLWILLCRDCPAISFLTRFFTSIAGLLAAIAALLVLIGQFGCAQGAAAAALVFLLVAAALRVGGRVIGCP
jgi:hypothetical protein